MTSKKCDNKYIKGFKILPEFTKIIFLVSALATLLISCSPIQSKDKRVKMDLDIIEQALINAKIIKSMKSVKETGMRIHIDNETDDSYFVHYGPADPYKGGSGANYSIDKTSGTVTLVSTEDLAEVPILSSDEDQ